MLVALLLAAPAFAGADLTSPAPPAGATMIRLPAMTLVMLRMSERVNSDRSAAGYRFHFTVSEPVRSAGRIVIPVGAQGEGEVIHAAESGGHNHPGELVLAARFVRVGAEEVKLRSFVAGATDRANDALAVPIFDRHTGGGRGDPANLGRGGVASARTAVAVRLPAIESDPAESADSAQAVDVAPAIDASATTGTIVLFREFIAGGTKPPFQIHDGVALLGELANGNYFAVQLPVGIHHLTARGPNFDDLSVEIDSGETYYVACSQGNPSFLSNCSPSNRSQFDYMKSDLRMVEGARPPSAGQAK